MATATYVYALILFGKDHLLVLQQTVQGWSLPCTRVFPGEDERQALTRCLKEFGYDEVEVIRSIGPRHYFKSGVDASAFEVEVFNAVSLPDEFRLMGKEQAASVQLIDEPAIQRMIWDGFSILQPWTNVPSPVPFEFLPIEDGIYCDPGMTHLLVEDYPEGGIAKRRQWPRLDPTSPTGKMESM